ncbi:TRAP transporter small permease subunit [Acuticoccus kandeliae]|uniref:TRAP transporter small permease subunit n=1 Tax=Acuticoccus kandeliae TaxID=2073160 RepID=UPI000D3E8934|nr:TRAP transporter small permease [Acuticoccus kandeliae]
MLDKVLWRVSLAMARMGGALFVATALLVSAEVILRKTGIVTFSVGTELSSYALAIAATWSFPLVLMVRGHVRIDIVSEQLPGRPRALLNVLAVASLAAVGLVLSWSALLTLRTSLELNAVSNTTLAAPLWIPQGLWLTGLLWFTVVAIVRTVVLVVAFLRNDLALIDQLAAPPSADAEADAAAQEARSRLALDEAGR